MLCAGAVQKYYSVVSILIGFDCFYFFFSKIRNIGKVNNNMCSIVSFRVQKRKLSFLGVKISSRVGRKREKIICVFLFVLRKA